MAGLIEPPEKRSMMTTTTTIRWRRLVFCLTVALALAGLAPRAHAWIPQGWVYAQLPYYHANKDATWYWFNDDLPVSDMSTGQMGWFRDRCQHQRHDAALLVSCRHAAVLPETDCHVYPVIEPTGSRDPGKGA
jgi:hypothetical protein